MKLNIALKTEYSFRQCYMPMSEIHKYAINGVVGIADYDNTFGHVPLQKEADKHSFKPVFGVRLRVSRDDQSRLQTGNIYTTFIARTQDGLQALYGLVQRAYDNFYFFPRLFESDLESLHPGIVNLGTGIHENFYPRPSDRAVYQLLAGTRKNGDHYIHRFESRIGPMFIIPLAGYDELAAECKTRIPTADMVKWGRHIDLWGECIKGANKRSLLITEEYEERLRYELNLIKQKDYEDYFMIVSDMVKEAKKTMLVGPSRGSSAGSLVCYLLEITEVDPIRHHLIFERFIDINRFDLPDIDIDFPDKQRQGVIDYLVSKYGRTNVRSLANVNTFGPKSAIGEFAQGLGIPKYETESVKDAFIERSSADARAAMCIRDTFDTTDPGKEFIEKYPKMRLVERIEGHASHAGKHAAGVLVSTELLLTYAAIDTRNDIIMIDKDSAEYLGLLKIDILGLRTLSILTDTINQIPDMDLHDLYTLQLDDQKAFDIFNQMRLSGVFQFEGYALQSLTRQMGVSKFEDIVAITALARPGALNSGGASRFVRYRTGADTPRFINEIHRRITGDTFGVTVYQEQMMEIAREVGHLSWEDVSTLRKAAAKSMGDEFFGKWKSTFIEGAIKKSGLEQGKAEELWNDISHSGSWSFNKSHAVSYALISYWTAYLKAHYPTEFAVASLNNARDAEHAIKLLRDMVQNEKLQYIPVDAKRSGIWWEAHNNRIVGGLTNIPGVGEKKAQMYIDMREGKRKITPSFWKILEDPKTEFDILFPAEHHWGMFWHDPISTGLVNAKPDYIKDIEKEGEYTFIGVLRDRNLRDLNEYTFLKDRDGEIIEENNLYLNLIVEDDTDSIICTINRWRFEDLNGKKIAEEGKIGEDWFLIQGRVKGSWRKIDIEQIISLNDWKTTWRKVI